MRDPVENPVIGRLTRRADFLRAAKGKRRHAGAFTVQAGPAATDATGVRIGFTLTRKVGNSVVRNRARRRLKEAVRLSPNLPVVAGHDYVVIGREPALRQPFAGLQRDLIRAFRDVHEKGRDGDDRQRRRPANTRPKRTGPET